MAKIRYRLLVAVSLSIFVVATLVACSGVSAPPPAAGAKVPAFAPDSYMAKIQGRGKLLVGVAVDVPMFGYLDPKTNKIEGFEIDLVKEIAKRIFGDLPDIDGKIEFREAAAKSRIPMVQEDLVDMVVRLGSITEERKQQVDFSDVYWLSGFSVVVLKDSGINREEDIGDKTIVSTRGSTAEDFIKKHYPSAKLMLVDNVAERVSALMSRRAQVTWEDSAAALSLVKTYPEMKVIARPLTNDPWGIFFKKGRPEFVAFVNGVLKDIKSNGTWKQMYQKNMPPGEVPEPPP